MSVILQVVKLRKKVILICQIASKSRIENDSFLLEWPYKDFNTKITSIANKPNFNTRFIESDFLDVFADSSSSSGSNEIQNFNL